MGKRTPAAMVHRFIADNRREVCKKSNCTMPLMEPSTENIRKINEIHGPNLARDAWERTLLPEVAFTLFLHHLSSERERPEIPSPMEKMIGFIPDIEVANKVNAILSTYGIVRHLKSGSAAQKNVAANLANACLNTSQFLTCVLDDASRLNISTSFQMNPEKFDQRRLANQLLHQSLIAHTLGFHGVDSYTSEIVHRVRNLEIYRLSEVYRFCESWSKGTDLKAYIEENGATIDREIAKGRKAHLTVVRALERQVNELIKTFGYEGYAVARPKTNFSIFLKLGEVNPDFIQAMERMPNIFDCIGVKVVLTGRNNNLMGVASFVRKILANGPFNLGTGLVDRWGKPTKAKENYLGANAKGKVYEAFHLTFETLNVACEKDIRLIERVLAGFFPRFFEMQVVSYNMELVNNYGVGVGNHGSRKATKVGGVVGGVDLSLNDEAANIIRGLDNRAIYTKERIRIRVFEMNERNMNTRTITHNDRRSAELKYDGVRTNKTFSVVQLENRVLQVLEDLYGNRFSLEEVSKALEKNEPHNILSTKNPNLLVSIYLINNGETVQIGAIDIKND
ncbi:MAG: hypothetical protein PHS02_00300 [Candidatus ainarchaeum sp.]|nr:hypothetical protein [Candidatus ainarchaeum sp.]